MTRLDTAPISEKASDVEMNYKDVAPLFLEYCIEGASERRYRHRQHVFLEGDEHEWIYQILSGAVCLYRILPEGRRQILGFGLPGDLLAVEATTAYTTSAQALGTTQLKCISRKSLNRLANSDARLSLQLYWACSAELQSTRDLLATLFHHGSTERVASFLLNFARRSSKAEPATLTLPMNRADIADHLGITIETVSRSLKKLAEQRLIAIRGRSTILVKDWEGLRLAVQPKERKKENGRAEIA